MSKKRKRFLVLFAVFALVAASFAGCKEESDGTLKNVETRALAEDENIVFTVGTDKESYKDGDEIKLTLKVENKSTRHYLQKVELKTILPSGFSVSGTETKEIARSISTDGTAEVTNTIAKSSGSWVAVPVVLAVAAAVWFAKRRRVKLGALLLVCCMVASVFAGVPMESQAISAIAIKTSVEYDGEMIELQVSVFPTVAEIPIVVAAEDKETVKVTGVHDPSIIYDEQDGQKTYYVFGTHLLTAKSTDLINWTALYSQTSYNGYFGVVDESGEVVNASFNDTFVNSEYTGKVKIVNADGEIEEVDFGSYDGEKWMTYDGRQGIVEGNMWAPDIIWNETMNKWCLYMSLNGDKWHSVIVLMTADDIEGPYVYQGPVVYSGFDGDSSKPNYYKNTDMELVYGQELSELPSDYQNRLQYDSAGVPTGGSWGDYYPNCIDPCVLYDDDGNLWFSYGSWSGGIYMFQLDEETGLRDYTIDYTTDAAYADYDTDRYFGIHIAGGAYVSGEASYIEKVGDYYYLWITYGGLEAAKGYNMRYYRSENIYGPYEDYKAQSPIYKGYVYNINQSRGVRIFGAYKWPTCSKTYAAQGHNSMFVDEDGKIYLLYHARNTAGGEDFDLRCQQLFQTKSGWLVAAPYRYTGETLNPEGYPASEVANEYMVMIHRLNIDFENRDAATYSYVNLNEDGTVTGAYEGSWELEEGTANMTLTLKENGVDVTYECLVLKQKIEGSSQEAMVFTGIGSNQVTIWGSVPYTK